MANKERQYLGTVILIMVLVMAVIILPGCSNSGDSSSLGLVGNAVIVDENGGIYTNDDIQVVFAKGALDGRITVSGEVVSLDTIPNDILPVSKVHRIILSDPSRYNAYLANIKFTIANMPEGVRIYHSDDGVTWYSLGGDITDSVVSARTHKFSYFFAGHPHSSTAQVYGITVANHTSKPVHVFLYDGYTSEAVVWQVLQVPSFEATGGETVSFQWTNTWSYYWAKSGLIGPGSIITPFQMANGDLEQNNYITLSNSGFSATSAGPGTDIELVSINVTNVPNNAYTTGYMLSNIPFAAAQAQPNTLQQYQPGYEYLRFLTIATGDYKQGEIIDPSTLSNPARLEFQIDQYGIGIDLNSDGSWTTW